MFRRLFRAVRHFLGAVVLVFGSICLIEVVLGVRHAQHAVKHQAETVEDLAVPSRTCFRELRPLATVQSPNGTIATNSFGLRGPEPACPKPPGIYRVLVLGDDATLATHLGEETTFCRQLQDTMLKGRTSLPVEVINAGQPGACPLTLSLLYRQKLATLSADAVVIVLSASDISDDLRYRPYLQTDSNGVALACPHPTLGGHEQPIDAWRSEFRLVEWAASRSLQAWVDRGTKVRSDLLAPDRAGEWLSSPVGVWSGPLESALAPLVQLKQDVESRYGQFVVTVAPDITTVDGPPAGWQAVARFAAQNNMIWIDPTQRIAQIPDPQALFDTTSYATANPSAGNNLATLACRVPLSSDGHRLIAIELAMHFTSLPGLARTNNGDAQTR